MGTTRSRQMFCEFRENLRVTQTQCGKQLEVELLMVIERWIRDFKIGFSLSPESFTSFASMNSAYQIFGASTYRANHHSTHFCTFNFRHPRLAHDCQLTAECSTQFHIWIIHTLNYSIVTINLLGRVSVVIAQFRRQSFLRLNVAIDKNCESQHFLLLCYQIRWLLRLKTNRFVNRKSRAPPVRTSEMIRRRWCSDLNKSRWWEHNFQLILR
jgi:hypothetical protein